MRKFYIFLFITLISVVAKANVPSVMCGDVFSCKNQEDLINFWIKVSTKYTSEEGFLHNRETMEIYKSIKTNNKQKIKKLKKIIASLKDISVSDIRFQRGFKDKFIEGLNKSVVFMKSIQKILLQQKLEKELFFLTFTESAFNPFALSKAGALGVWQITKTCWQDYLPLGLAFLRVDPVYSSFVAASFLKDSLDIFNDYSLAITAYNYGIKSLSKAVGNLRTKNLRIISKIFDDKNLGFAVKNFYPSFLASRFVAKRILKNYSLEKINNMQEFVYIIAPLKINNNINFINIKLNPVVEYLKYIPKFYPIRAYPENVSKITSSLMSVLIRDKPDFASKFIYNNIIKKYKIQRGDSLLYLAQKFKTTVKKLMKLNNIKQANKIFIGQNIVINQKVLEKQEDKKEKNTKNKKIQVTLDGISTWAPLYEYLIENENSLFFIVNKGNLLLYNKQNIRNYSMFNQNQTKKIQTKVYKEDTVKESFHNKTFNLKRALNDKIFNVYSFNKSNNTGLIYLAPWETVKQISAYLKVNIFTYAKIPIWRNPSYQGIPVVFNKLSKKDFIKKRKEYFLALYKNFLKKYTIREKEKLDIDININKEKIKDYPSYLIYFYNPEVMSVPLKKLKKIFIPKLKRYGDLK